MNWTVANAGDQSQCDSGGCGGVRRCAGSVADYDGIEAEVRARAKKRLLPGPKWRWTLSAASRRWNRPMRPRHWQSAETIYQEIGREPP